MILLSAVFYFIESLIKIVVRASSLHQALQKSAG